MDHLRLMTIMPDGTIKQINPFTGTEVWAVPGRGHRPMTNGSAANLKLIEHHLVEDYCNFCAAHYLSTPPEKDRLVQEGNSYHSIPHVAAADLFKSHAVMRRIPNLFEIVTIDYWEKNYGYRLSNRNRMWKDQYLATTDGQSHVRRVLEIKLAAMGRPKDELSRIDNITLARMADAFFGGAHELIVMDLHYKPDAQSTADLLSSGDLTPDEHDRYFAFTISALQDIYAQNRYVRYVAAFQNWLRAAGASFDHLHKQLVGLDDWGNALKAQSAAVRGNPNVFNEAVANFASYNNLVVAENEYALAFVEIGHLHPTLSVYSKSQRLRPWEHLPEEIRGISNMVHACHAALGSGVSSNEEWYYLPVDSVDRIPWHVQLHLRINNPAGFEGGTRIYINPLTPYELRDKIVPRLYELRQRGKISSMQIAEECVLRPNPLRYIQASASE
jgi:galactose-1-phosphate uridylyltransferase